jgi:hypothetical protein
VARLTAVSAHHRARPAIAPALRSFLYDVPVSCTCMAFIYAVQVLIADPALYAV